MPRRLWSRRFANRVVNVGRVALRFRGEVAEIPDWADAEYAWIVSRMSASIRPLVPPAPRTPTHVAPEPRRPRRGKRGGAA